MPHIPGHMRSMKQAQSRPDLTAPPPTGKPSGQFRDKPAPAPTPPIDLQGRMPSTKYIIMTTMIKYIYQYILQILLQL